MKITSSDILAEKIPNHILEKYPNFYEFIRAYYEWLHLDGNALERLKNHNDYLTFEKTLDEYVNFMLSEYLNDIPENVLFDKQLFIRWSRKFNLTRGSHESIKFLFRILFGEDTTKIYIPKENILRASDGVWISGESLMLVSYDPSNQEQFQYQTIYQERELFPGIFERATANVQRVKTKYLGKYVVTELSVSNIQGEFKLDEPILTNSGVSEWIIPTIHSVVVTNKGTEFKQGQRLIIDAPDTYEIERIADVEGSFDCRVKTFFNQQQISLFVNTIEIDDFEFDGRYLVSNEISVNDDIKVVLPAFDGYIVVDRTNTIGGVENIEIIEPVIGYKDNQVVNSNNINGQGINASTVLDAYKPVQGYYEGTKGQLSSNMYLADNNFYQNFSYQIKTQQNIREYVDIVKKVLHPAGMKLFGSVEIVYELQSILTYVEGRIEYLTNIEFNNLHKYGMGSNHAYIRKFREWTSPRLYKDVHFDSMDVDYLNGESGYNLESFFLTQHLGYGYPKKKGYMSKANKADYYNYMEQGYYEELPGTEEYFETGYVGTT